MNIPATRLRRGMHILERNARGRIVCNDEVAVAMPGCQNHMHVTLTDNRHWCFDDGAILEVSL